MLQLVQLLGQHFLGDTRQTAPQFTKAHCAIVELPENAGFPTPANEFQTGFDWANMYLF
jgi:hypothetical protein